MPENITSDGSQCVDGDKEAVPAKPCDGILVIDKPTGITSRKATDRVKCWFPRGTRIGHTGTLDPLATGVLVLCLNRATRLAEYVQRMPKVYAATFRFGVESDTDDADGHILTVPAGRTPSLAEVEEGLRHFQGEFLQAPPKYSALKVGGRRAYAQARLGREVSIESRPVTVHRLDIVEYAPPLLRLTIKCGRGTYIRSIARDLGSQMGCGAIVQELRRLAVGHFDLSRAAPLEADEQMACQHILPMIEAVAELPRLTIRDCDVEHFRRGLPVAIDRGFGESGEVAVLDENGNLLGIGAAAGAPNTIRPHKVLA
jgi:tRNA pseudouridine55 synthase